MSTLTAGQPRLASYCDHKLPTSCRLSSIPDCCACADQRAHAASYSTYIDGIGFVPRGNRWQRYCWFCKEFWDNRVQASGLPPSQTRIPDVPDQGEFLERWYEFHQGYRLITKDDGSQERVAVLGEDLREVSPGHLPRTMEEMRAGRLQSSLAEREAQQRQANARQSETPEPTGPSLEEALDQLYHAVESESDARQTAAAAPPASASSGRQDTNVISTHTQSSNGLDVQSSDSLLRALDRDFNQMSGIMERVTHDIRALGATAPLFSDVIEAVNQLNQHLDGARAYFRRSVTQTTNERANTRGSAGSTGTSQPGFNLIAMQSRLDDSRRVVDEARRSRDQAASDHSQAEEHLRSSQASLRQLQNELRTAQNFTRLFGTREQILAQGDDYESPLSFLFRRAEERYHDAEEVRREERTLRRVLQDETMVDSAEVASMQRQLDELQTRQPDVWGVPRSVPRNGHGQGAEDNRRRRTSSLPTQQTEGQTPAQANPTRVGNEILAGLEEYNEMLAGREQSERELGLSAGQTYQASDVHEHHNLRLEDIDLEDIVSVPTEPPIPLPPLLEPIVSLTGVEAVSEDAHGASDFVAGPPGLSLDADPRNNNDDGLDALFLLGAISRSEALQRHLPTGINISDVQQCMQSVQQNSLTELELDTVKEVMNNVYLIWSAGLPQARIARRRQRGETVTFSLSDADYVRDIRKHEDDTELMAECFQMSSRIRGFMRTSDGEQMRMLERLHRGERRQLDILKLSTLLLSEDALEIARSLREHEPDETSRERVSDLDRERQALALQGDHTRAELDAQRRATRFAEAAGRQAMQMGPTALLERQMNAGEEANAALMGHIGYVPSRALDAGLRTLRRRPNVWDTAEWYTNSPSESEQGSEEEALGLDAKDDGRPDEAMTDEEMTVKLDCRVCYSQIADIACLPCGHLVMCKWCSEQHSPAMAHDKTRPRRPANCPVCRKAIRQKVRVFRA